MAADHRLPVLRHRPGTGPSTPHHTDSAEVIRDHLDGRRAALGHTRQVHSVSDHPDAERRFS